MATKCYSPILGKVLRVTELDSCGNVPAAATADSLLVTEGFISVTLSSEVEEGEEIITKTASGALCVNEKLPGNFKRFTVEIQFCQVNPSLLAFMTNAETYADYAADVAGFTVPEGIVDKRFAFELWTGIAGQACPTGSTFYGGYLLLPFVNAGILGDIEVTGDDAITFSMTQAYTVGGNAWGIGPYNVIMDDSTPPVPGPLPTALDDLDHLLLIDTTVAPPTSSCTPYPMPPYITLIAPITGAAAGGTAVTITGVGFTGATAVNFGATPGTAFSVVSDTSITVTSPAHAAGAVDVTVVKSGGNAVDYAGYTYT
jgi:hypothetical protein